MMKKFQNRKVIMMRKKMLSLISATLLCLLPILTACDSEGEELTADTMRLVNFSGEVVVTDIDNSDITPTESMLLKTGYTVSTAIGEAFILLDDEKAIKLSDNTNLTVNKNGHDLVVELNSGELFFNVTAPLENHETLNIKTSNMVTGIRGTSGYVISGENLEDGIHYVGLLEGKVEVTYLNEEDGKETKADIVAGQLAEHIEDNIGDTISFRIVEEVAENVPDFVRDEVRANKELQDKIDDDDGYLSADLIGDDDDDIDDDDLEDDNDDNDDLEDDDDFEDDDDDDLKDNDDDFDDDDDDIDDNDDDINDDFNDNDDKQEAIEEQQEEAEERLEEEQERLEEEREAEEERQEEREEREEQEDEDEEDEE